VTNRADEVVFTFEDGEIRRVDLIPGPEGVDAQYFVRFVPQGVRARVGALSAKGKVLRSLQVTAP
jgi:hypothetical protein